MAVFLPAFFCSLSSLSAASSAADLGLGAALFFFSYEV